MKSKRFRALRAGWAAGATVLLLGACEPIIHTDGQVVDEQKLAAIQPGVQTQSDVEDLLGTPSSASVFGEKTWLYMSKRTSRIAFFEPSILEQNITEIRFDDTGLVASVRQYGLGQAKEVAPVARTTPTEGKKLTFLDQMLGNLNRYGAGAAGRAGPSGPAGPTGPTR